MKKAVIEVGSKQFLISEGDLIEVSIAEGDKKLSLPALLVVDGDKIIVGTPATDTKVELQIQDFIKVDKVVAIRHKAKKRVQKRRGHRQVLAQAKITKIS